MQDEGDYEMIEPCDPAAAHDILHQPRRFVPAHIPRPLYAEPEDVQKAKLAADPEYAFAQALLESGMSIVHLETALGGEEERCLRAAARLAAEVLRVTGEKIAQNVS